MARLEEDRLLLEAFRRGEPAALESVYREYARPVFAFFTSGFSLEIGGKTSVFKGYSERWAIEEAVQEVFVRAFSPSARLAFDGVRPYRNYLFTIARNLYLDRLRGQARAAQENGVCPPTQGPDPSPEESATAAQLSALCDGFLEGLEDWERRLFHARFREGLSIEKTAALLGISEHHVKRSELSLKRRFFVELRSHGYFEGFRFGRAGLERLMLVALFISGASR
jgi:RNA polymerase sigma factor (sigma-70 family)